MCKCHPYNKETRRFERKLGEASLNSVCEGEIFHFLHEPRILRTRKTFYGIDSYCPPIDPEVGSINFTGGDDAHRFLNAARVNVISAGKGANNGVNADPEGRAE